MAEKDNGERELIIEEYKSLRQEQLNKMDKQYQITGVGIGAIATLLATAYEKLIYPLFLILPLVILGFIALYEAESRAIISAAEYIKELETEIIREHPKLGWERWLKNKGRSKIYNLIDHSSRFIFLLLYIGCILGIIAFPEQEGKFMFLSGDLFRNILVVFYTLIGLAIFLFYTSKQSKKRSY